MARRSRHTRADHLPRRRPVPATGPLPMHPPPAAVCPRPGRGKRSLARLDHPRAARECIGDAAMDGPKSVRILLEPPIFAVFLEAWHGGARSCSDTPRGPRPRLRRVARRPSGRSSGERRDGAGQRRTRNPRGAGFRQTRHFATFRSGFRLSRSWSSLGSRRQVRATPRCPGPDRRPRVRPRCPAQASRERITPPDPGRRVGSPRFPDQARRCSPRDPREHVGGVSAWTQVGP